MRGPQGAACDTRVRVVDGSPRERILAFSAMAKSGADEWDVMRVARDVAWGLRSDEARARALMEFVQRLPYWPDPPGTKDFIAQPCRVLVIGGDCEDLATLLVALWVASGLTGRLVWIVQEGDQDHVAPEVYLPARGWLWGETTVRGARLGEYPKQAAARLGVQRSRRGAL